MDVNTSSRRLTGLAQIGRPLWYDLPNEALHSMGMTLGEGDERIRSMASTFDS